MEISSINVPASAKLRRKTGGEDNHGGKKLPRLRARGPHRRDDLDLGWAYPLRTNKHRLLEDLCSMLKQFFGVCGCVYLMTTKVLDDTGEVRRSPRGDRRVLQRRDEPGLVSLNWKPK